MSSIKRFALPLAAACIALVVLLSTASSAYAFALPGITPSGVPVFANNVKVRYNPNNQVFKAFTNGAGRDFVLLSNDGDGGLDATSGRGSYTLKATIDNNGVCSGTCGTVVIKGGMDSLGISGGGNILMSADLVGFNGVSSPFLLGFNTNNIFCHQAIEDFLGGCTNAESVYLVMNSEFSGDFTSSFSGSATAHTTVPVPAAAWLFGSALGLLGWVRRHTNRAKVAA